ncbi:MAG: N-formylglutamate amidohydrolase [Gammaproteobacteria bacterium]
MTPFRYLPAAKPIGVIASIPHTGTWLPETVRARLASDTMRALPMTDWHLHALYDFLPRLGIPVVHATVSRFAGDLNRSPEPLELYPGRVETKVVPTETFWGDAVWADPPSDLEIARWIDDWHRPYHACLSSLIEETRAAFGRVVLLDLHSVAGRANRIHGELAHDIYLGDRDGTSCDTALTDAFEATYRDAGLHVTRNAPYKGGFITHHYGALEYVDALQIEMVQRVYMDETAPEGAPSRPLFEHARRRLAEIFRSIEWG